MEYSIKQTKKIQYLDILRILATYFVVLLHCMAPFIVRLDIFNTKSWWFCLIANSIVRTGVPIFFMISGFLLLNDSKTLSIISFYKRRAIRILIPFLAWDVIYFIFNSIKNNNSLSVKRFFSELFISGSSYHLWYVYTLLGIYLLLPFVKKIIDNCSVKQLLWFFAIVLFATNTKTFLSIITPFKMYLFDPLVNGYFGYVVLGYILAKYDIAKNVRYLIYLGGLAGIFISIFGNRNFSSASYIDLVFNSAFMPNHFLTASAIFVFFKHLKPIKNTMICNFITLLSASTYSIYLIHVLILDIIDKYIIFPRALLIICANFFIVSFVSMITILILSKIKYFNKVFL